MWYNAKQYMKSTKEKGKTERVCGINGRGWLRSKGI